MKHKGLLFLQVTSDDYTGLCIENTFLPLKSYLFSTRKASSISFIDKIISLIFMLVVAFPLVLNAQPGLQGAVHSRVNDPTVTVKVDKPLAKQGDLVTITLEGKTEGKTVEVKVGNTFGNQDIVVNTNTVQGNLTYTFNMPDYSVYIDVVIQPSVSGDVSYALSIETPGVSAGKVKISVTGEKDGDVTASADSYLVKVGAKVTATLQTSLSPGLYLLSVRGYAPDGSWQVTPLVGTDGKVPSEIIFTMPAAEVVLCFSFDQQSIPDPGPDPIPDPDPDPSPDPDPDPTPDPVANEKVATATTSFCLRRSGNILYICNDRSGTACIYTFGGSLVRTVNVAAGEQPLSLPRGMYIVRMGEESRKIIW